ncbi:LytR/AlgR family response regulator transcription factor [Bifidobacterium pullorum]|uniref:LytR/AlgR family response regulator transcription factor n=1 Tax=Bifidobacterium pullorum TaxID=78448 RepID=UPI003AF9C61B
MVAVAVVDDDAEARERLRGFSARFASEQGIDVDVSMLPSAIELLHHYRPEYDIIFLDIEMDDVDGVRAAQVIRETDASTILIFVTNMAQLAIKGYEVEALDFIVKPIDYYSFAMVMRKALQRMERRRRHAIRLATRGAVQVIPLDHIDYVEVRDHYITYHTADGDIRVKGSLSDAETQLDNGNFMRCNRWYLVNVDNITGISGNLITVGTGAIEVSRSKKQEILHAITRSMGGAL